MEPPAHRIAADTTQFTQSGVYTCNRLVTRLMAMFTNYGKSQFASSRPLSQTRSLIAKSKKRFECFPFSGYSMLFTWQQTLLLDRLLNPLASSSGPFQVDPL
jgi:hypothetical protein